MLATAVLGVLLVGGYLAVAFYAGDRVPRGTAVAGVEVGGLQPAAAEEKLAKELGKRQGQPIAVRADGKQYDVSPKDAGLALDAGKTVEAVHGSFSLNPARVYHVVFGANQTEPALRVDQAKLDNAVAGLAKKVDRKPAEGSISFADGKVTAKQPKAGVSLDRDEAAEQVSAAYLSDTAPPTLTTAEAEPKVPAEEYTRVMDEFAKPAMSGPIRVDAGKSGSFEISEKDLGSALSVKHAGDKLTTTFDKKKLNKAVAEQRDEIGSKPKDATVRLQGGQPTVVAGRSGKGIEPKQLGAAVEKVLTEKGSARVAKVTVKKKEPDLSTKRAEKLGVKEVVGEFSTTYPYAEYRNTNIGRAAELIDGTFLEPDEIFSLNDLVGERTQENGFTEGSVIESGRLVDALGGGVSQLATTTYNAGFFAGMEDVEHRPHAFYISRYPAGREATVYWGSIDLRFRNNTPHGVLVDATVDKASPGGKGKVTVRLWSTKYWDVDYTTSDRYNFRPPKKITDDQAGCVPQAGSSGFDIKVTRTLKRDGKVVRTEPDVTNYQAEDQVVCTG